MKKWMIIFGVCLSVSLSAQVPGYMGKRLAVGYHMDFGAVLDYIFYELPSINYNGKSTVDVWLATRHNIDAEWGVGKKVSLQASVGFSRNGLFSYGREGGMLKDEYPKLSSEYSSGLPEDQRPYDYIRARNTLYKIGVNIFNKNYVAPHGNYWNISMLANRSHVEYVVRGEAKDLTLIKSYGILFSKGYRRIIKDAVILDGGFGMGWLLGDSGGSSIIGWNQRVQNSPLVFHWHFGVKYLLPDRKK
jgi:hypothetical protein